MNPATATPDIKEKYISDFDFVKKDSLYEKRKAAIDRFAELGFPTNRNEDWKYTDISPIVKDNSYKLGVGSWELAARLPDGQVDKFPNGVVVQKFSDAIKNHKEVFEKYFDKNILLNDGFTALNTAFAQEGIFIFIPENTVVEKPIELSFSPSVTENSVFHLRNLIVVGKNSQVTLVEKYSSDYTKVSSNKSALVFNNVVSEIFLEENSSLEFYKTQNENLNTFHIQTTQIQQQKNSKFSSNNITLGGAIVLNSLNVVLDGENCETLLNGLFIGSENQLIDNHTFVDHAKPNCHSNELYKGVLDGKATGVFNGKIMVRKDAQKTNAFQSNKNILLSDNASINSKPQLEIFADDVKCSHGATTGRLDKEALFYLRSRGIDEDRARALLVFAFANEIIESIKIDSLKEHLKKLLFEKLNVNF